MLTRMEEQLNKQTDEIILLKDETHQLRRILKEGLQKNKIQHFIAKV